MVWSFHWLTSASFSDIQTSHGVVIGAVFAPTAAIFKFAFDAIDGKIDDK